MADKRQQGEFPSIDIENLIKHVAAIFGLIAGAVGLLYGIGFAVVNISLLRYGVYEVTLVRARYISAGVFYLVFFTLLVGGSLGSLALSERIIQRPRREPWSQSSGREPWLSLLLSLILIIVICFVLALGVWEFSGLLNFVSHLSQYFAQSTDFYLVWESFKRLLSVQFLIWCLLISLFVLLVVRRHQIPGLRNLLPRADTGVEGVPSAAFKAYLVVCSTIGIPLLLLLYYFGHSAYATFPAALGGGLPVVVQFSVIDDESTSALEKLGISLETPALTRKVDLIAQTDARYIVLVWDPVLERDVAVSFEKSFVNGIRYYPDEYYLSNEYAAGKYTQEGQASINEGRWDTAIEWFEDALHRVPNYPPALIGKGDALLALEKYDGAIECFKKVLEEDKSNTVAQYGLARAYALLGQAGNAMDFLEKAIEGDKNYQEKAKEEADFEAIKLDDRFIELVFLGKANAAIWYGQAGDTQRGDEKWDAAVAEYTRAISLTIELKDKTGEASYRYRRAGVYLKLDKQGDALDDYQAAAKLEPNNATYHFGLAEAYAAQQNFQDALPYYKTATDLKPDYIAAWIAWGDAQRSVNDYENAVKSYTEAIAIDRNSHAAYYGRARAEAHLEMSREAVQDLRQAIILYPTYIQMAKSEPDFDKIREETGSILSAAQHNQEGNQLANEGKLEEAIREYLEALKLDPTNAAYHANQGDVYRRLQQLGDAEEEYRRAIRYDMENDSYHYRLAGFYYDQGKFDSAIEEYERALAINDEKPTYHSGLGDAYRQMDVPEKAGEAYEQAIRLDQSNASYHARLADIYYRQGKQEDALRKYLEAIRLDEENYMYHYGLARVYYALDEPQEAIQSYQAAIKLNPEYGEAYCGLGQAYQKSKQRQDAIEAFEQCRDVSQDEGLKKQAEEALAELGAQ
jgi:tetratricopeptide (TPR) repeat protein